MVANERQIALEQATKNIESQVRMFEEQTVRTIRGLDQ